MSEPIPQAWHDALRSQCEQNGTVEITLLSALSAVGVRTSCRVRLLAVGPDGALEVEQPTLTDDLVGDYAPGTPIQVLVVDKNHRWEGVCALIEATQHQLNETKTVAALRLGPATEVRSAQRRAFFRVNTSGIPIEIAMSSLAGSQSVGDMGSASLDVLLQNISGGGIGVLVPLSAHTIQSLRQRLYWHCSISLPSIDEPIELKARLVHVHPITVDTALLGLEFEGNPDEMASKAQDQIVRFNTWVQREQLRRRRGA